MITEEGQALGHGYVQGNINCYCPKCSEEQSEAEGRRITVLTCDHDREAETPKERLEELRIILRSESISWGELAELQSLSDYIEPGDVELAEAAGIDEQEFSTRTEAAVVAAANDKQRQTLADMKASGHIVFLDC